MRKIRFVLCALASALCSLILLGGCAWLGGGDSSSPNKPWATVNITAKVKYEGKIDEGVETVRWGDDYTLRAYDTEDYAFAFWECNGEPVSDEAEYIFTAERDETYYAVFAPKAEDEVLINVVYERDDYVNAWYEGIGVIGEGYQKKNEALCLSSDGDLPVSWFSVRNSWLTDFEDETRGPALNITPENSLTVVATFEKVCEIVLVDTPNCSLRIEEGDVLMAQDETLSVAMEVEDGYVAECWTIAWYPIPGAEQDGFRAHTRQDGVNWGKDWAYEMPIDSLCHRLEISLTVTDKNLSKAFQVEVIQEEGFTDLDCTMSIPDNFLRHAMFSGYYMSVYPSENAYIKDMEVRIERSDDNPYYKYDTINAFHGEYFGGYFHISDAYDFGEYEDITVRIFLASRETHAIVNLISCNEEITYTPDPNGGYAPSITTQSFVVKKGALKEFHMHYTNNLAKIYEAGYQFSHIADAKGKVISETIEFAYAPTEDTDLYIHYEKKPIADKYFDYHWSDEGDGYEVRLSQLSILPYSDYEMEYQEELYIPSTYNGKPVVEIPDFGFSYFQLSGNGMREDYGAHVYGTLYVPSSIKRIGAKAFAHTWGVKIVFDENVILDEISPDAFYSKVNSVKVKMSKMQLEGVVKGLHEQYIGDADGFELHFEPAEHFKGENVVGHYESLTEYICIRADDFDLENISTYDFWKIFHEFAHHYQMIAWVGLGEETYESLKIKPTQEEVEAWKQPYDTEDQAVYWNHPMEVSARAFAEEWTGICIE